MPTLSKQQPPPASEVAGHPLVAAVERLIARQPDGQWTGRSSDLLAELNVTASETARRAPGIWPATPEGLSFKIRYVENGLKARGIAFYRPPNKTGAIHLYRVAQAAA